MDVDPTLICEMRVGLPDANVLGVIDESGGALRVVIEIRVRYVLSAGCRRRSRAGRLSRSLICPASAGPSDWCGASAVGSLTRGRRHADRALNRRTNNV